MVILITGKPNAGKTTLAYKLKENSKKEVVILDGDELRDALNYNDYTLEGRTKWMLDVAKIAKVFERQGLDVIISLVSPLKEVRKDMLDMFEESTLVYIEGNHNSMWKPTNNNCSIYQEPNEDGDGADYYFKLRGYDNEKR